MILTTIDANDKLIKFTHDPKALSFALSPQGYLLIKRGKNIEVADFCLLHNNHYCRRNGLMVDTDLTLGTHGTVLCCYSKERFIAPIGSEGCEYATAKKPLSPDFSLALCMRFAERIILLVADGKFAPQAFLITLADTHSNELFATAIIKTLAESRNPTIARKLFEEQGGSVDGQEE